jgi:hypothetical protein
LFYHKKKDVGGLEHGKTMGKWGFIISNQSLVGGLEHLLFSIIYGNSHPNLLSYFQRG